MDLDRTVAGPDPWCRYPVGRRHPDCAGYGRPRSGCQWGRSDSPGY